MNILIVNTGRFGDVIQTYPLIKGLKKKYPDSRLYYLVLENFKEPVLLFKEIDFIITVNFTKILKEIDYNNLQKAFIELKSYFAKFNSIEFDLLINISFSKLSACISSIFKAKNKRGLILTESNEFIATDNWSKFFLSIVDYREYCPFNLVDIFAKIGGINPEHIEIKVKKDIKNIGFQMGASTYNRKWSVKNFAHLAKMLINNNPKINIFLFGSKGEKDLGKEFLSYYSNENIKNMIGKTTILELYKILKENIDLLVTNDTGTMHLCWYAGKKVIELSLGPAYYVTTAPYGEFHTIVQPDIECSPCSYQTECLNLKCHNCISPELIYKIIINQDINLFNKVKIIETFYDNDKFLDYNHLVPKKNKKNNKLRQIWFDLLDERINFEEFYKKNKEINDIQTTIKQNIKEIEKILNKKDADLTKNINKIETYEKILKEHIYSSYQEFIPFFKYFEYLKMDLPENDFFKIMKTLKNNYLKLYYVFSKKIEKNKEI